jgi:outer membrane protein insertion porin family
MWDLSILRLNQLGYFNQVKKEDATINTNEKEGQVDLTLKVEEKGRQQISFTGGLSGIGGSYIGINYSTNNFLGYGETFSFNLSTGNLQKVISIGVTEPYVKGRPISVGFNIFYQNYQFIGQGFGATNTASILGTFNGSSLFTQKTAGASISASAPLSYFAKRFRMGRFVRLGLSYSFQTTDIVDPAVNRDSDPANDILVTFRQSGVTQSTVSPSIVYNTLNNSLDPTKGSSITMALAFTGGPLGGKVNSIAPTFEYKFFRPLFAGREARARIDAGKNTRTFGARFQIAHIGSFGNAFQSNSLSFVGGTPLFSRFFLGGEQDIRGYNIRSISPSAPVNTTDTTKNVHAIDVLTGQTLKIRKPSEATGNSIAPDVLDEFTVTNQIDTTVPSFPAFIGGDTQVLVNLEYRIPIFGPLQFAPFFDIGSSFNLRKLTDQFETSEFLPNQFLSGALILNPRGEIATLRQLRRATPPESQGGLPPGFKTVLIQGDKQVSRDVQLGSTAHGIFDNYRYSMGGELRMQVPVINVPFRLIFAWNPNARTQTDLNPFFFEQKRAIRFSVGRTF